jgi:uncharacterized protein YjbI with pentapeptide repeats
VSEPPRAPYPPDLGEEPDRPDLAAGVVDTVVDGVDWANVRAVRTTLRRVVLKSVRLTGTELAECTLADAEVVDCNLHLAGLRASRLERVVFRDCRMDECDLYGATLTDVLFERCSLRLATLSGAKPTRVELRGCALDGLRGVEALAGVRMPFHDALENAALFANGLGIELFDP